MICLELVDFVSWLLLAFIVGAGVMLCVKRMVGRFVEVAACSRVC